MFDARRPKLVEPTGVEDRLAERQPQASLLTGRNPFNRRRTQPNPEAAAKLRADETAEPAGIYTAPQELIRKGKDQNARAIEWSAKMKRKHERAARYTWLAVAPDPPWPDEQCA